jgi:arylsulfatase
MWMPGRLAPQTAGAAGRMTACVLLAAALGACQPASAPESPAGVAARPPNILLIVADDLGYADLGAFGSEIPTPQLDELARRGLLLTGFYAGMTCAPTRSMLLSGLDNHLAGVGIQGQPRRQDHMNEPGYLGYLNFRVASLAELMSDAGYNTYVTGKWHLGAELETGPRARGFKRSFVSLDGAAHLGPWDWRGPQLARYRDGDDIVNVDDSFYSTRFYTERMLEYIDADRDQGQPFFAYLAYTAPHWPLQAPAESIAGFSGRYDAGYEALYAERFARQQSLGLVAPDVTPIDNARFEPRWDTLSDEQRAIESRHMEIYAAMVSDLDNYVGQVIDYLKAIDEYDNTLIFFMSDNGAESGRTDLTPGIQAHVGLEYDHSLANLGSATSYINYGRNWASASATPFNRHKSTAFEGGVHVPAFVHFPQRIEAGRQSNATATVMDLLPTFLALAGTEHPGSPYRGREVLPPQGVSMLPLLLGESAAVHPPNQSFGWELYGHRAVRQGNWKLVWDQGRPPEQRRWQLHNLGDDPSEQRDRAAEDPERVATMLELWARYDEVNSLIY